ncbi:GtrA family protein [Bosea sp. PAMC 26642]|uniref:GtrA family protein n=1 Tax=Bosea sp. (strain PAMC 26642) TaxID=1792307 RepID=UPI0007701A15|nr:GtrA family protein [Bosea sp. PAMC 26642]AMJ62705.1 hypothetical protein AXW83_22540 [Bosea sp. PAMC 26642]
MVSNASLLCVFIVLTHMGLGAVPAAMTVYGLGVAGTYAANRSWSFSSDIPHPVAASRYILVHAVGAGTQALLQFVAHNLLGFDAVLIQAFGMIAVAVLSFVLLDIFAFAKSKQDDRGNSSL